VRRPARGHRLRQAGRADARERGPQRGGREQPLCEPAAVQRRREPGLAHARLLAHDLHQQGNRVGAARGGRRQPFEQREAVRDQDPARRRRRVRHELAAAIRHAHGPPPDDAVLLQVAQRHRPPSGAHSSCDRVGELAAVQGRCAVAREQLQRAAEIRKREGVGG